MSTSTTDYWKECMSIAAAECDLTLTSEQLRALADSAEAGHDHYGMAFYSPPPSERLDAIKSEGDAKYAALKREFEAYQGNAEQAIKKALRISRSTPVSICKYGEVLTHDGRPERAQW